MSVCIFGIIENCIGLLESIVALKQRETLVIERKDAWLQKLKWGVKRFFENNTGLLFLIINHALRLMYR